MKLFQKVVLAFSFLFYLSSVITNMILYKPSYHASYQRPISNLHHLPEYLGIYCFPAIYLYMWFYNQLDTYIYRSLCKFILHMTTFHQTPKLRHRKHRSFNYLQFYLLLYISTNLALVTGCYYNMLPLSSLATLPSILCFSTLSSYLRRPPTISLDHFYNDITSNKHLFTFSDTQLDLAHTDVSSLAYLSAWQSTLSSSSRIMNFSPGGLPVCIDTGASSCISNNKSDFLDLQPTSNTVLKGIGSGLRIEGTGTICWKLLDNAGDEISLYI